MTPGFIRVRKGGLNGQGKDHYEWFVIYNISRNSAGDERGGCETPTERLKQMETLLSSSGRNVKVTTVGLGPSRYNFEIPREERIYNKFKF